MNNYRKRRKFSELKQHRDLQYQKAIQGVIDGKFSPEYATERWRKIKVLQSL